MAYPEMVCLRQLLEEDLIPFLLYSLEFEESKVNSLAPTSRSSAIHVHGIYGREILTRIPYAVHLLDEMNSNSSLENLVDNRISSIDTAYVSKISAQQSCREITIHPVVINLLSDVAEEAISVHDSLANLLLQVKDSNDHHPEMDRMKVVVGRVGDQVEDFLTGYSFSVKRTDIEALIQVKNIIHDLRDDIDLLGGSTLNLNRLILGGELVLKHESSSRSEIQHSGGRLHNKSLVNVASKYEELDTSLLRSSNKKNLSTLHSGVHRRFVELSNIVMDFDGEITKIVDELTRPPSPLSIVTIAGMGGIGKTTLAKKVYHDSRVVYHFHFMAWASDLSSTDRALSHLLHEVIQEQSTSFHDEIRSQIVLDKRPISVEEFKEKKVSNCCG